MQTAEKLLVVAGITVGVFLLAQAAYRSGTNPIDVSTMFDGLHLENGDKQAEAMMRKFADQAGMDWQGFNDALAEDMPIFQEGIRNGGNDETPGASANLGGLSGRPYTMIDGEFYFQGGR